MERLKNIFNSDEKIISVFFTAGHPNLNTVKPLCEMLETAGVGVIEIGIPSSDPLADGPVIQQSSTVALQNKMTMEILFHELKDIRKCVNIPILLMGYYNQVLQFGVKNIISKAIELGIDGFIIPDQPVACEFTDLCIQKKLANVRLVCPTTSVDRIMELDRLSTGFLYAVSTSATTGTTKADNRNYLNTIGSMKLNNPVITGFGIRDKTSFDKATEHTKGGIIGTAFIEFISKPDNLNQQKINQFINSIKK